jgi:hypothetical protein
LLLAPLEAGCRATRTLVDHFLYEALGCSPPPPLVVADKSTGGIELRFEAENEPFSPWLSPPVSRYFPAAVAKVYIVTFRSNDNRRPAKFIVLADGRKEAINMAWEHGGPDFQSRFDKATGQAQ